MADEFEVTSVTLLPRIGGDGRLVQTAQVSFELTGERGSGYVTVPAEGNWQEAARAKVETEVEAMLGLLADPAVTSVNIDQQIGTGSRLERAVHIEYELPGGGGSGAVDVVADEDWEAAARAEVEAQVQAINALLGM
jgi:hypothetical protein